MQKSQQGIALVEVVLAIVLLGIVVVTVLGQFDEGSDEMTAAVYRNVDTRISSAAAINYTARILDPVTTVALTSVNDCASGQYTASSPSDFDAPDYGIASTDLNCR